MSEYSSDSVCLRIYCPPDRRQLKARELVKSRTLKLVVKVEWGKIRTEISVAIAVNNSTVYCYCC